MRLHGIASAIVGAATLVAGSSLAEAGGGGKFYPNGGFGYGPGLGGIYGGYMVPGYPYFGGRWPSSSSNNRSNVVRRNTNVRTQSTSTANAQPIQVVCPADAGTPLHYQLNGRPFVLKPGESQLLMNDRKWVVSFDRGDNHGTARYSMSPGTYEFELTADRGWELFHDADLSRFQKPAADATNALPPQAR